MKDHHIFLLAFGAAMFALNYCMAKRNIHAKFFNYLKTGRYEY